MTWKRPTSAADWFLPTVTSGALPTFSVAPSNFFFAASSPIVSEMDNVAIVTPSFLSCASTKPSFSCVKTRLTPSSAGGKNLFSFAPSVFGAAGAVWLLSSAVADVAALSQRDGSLLHA